MKTIPIESGRVPVNLEEWQEKFLKDVPWDGLQSRSRSGILREPLYPINDSKERDFFSAPGIQEVFLSIHSPSPSVWDTSFSDFPGASVEIKKPEDLSLLNFKIENQFLRGSFWRNLDTLLPWLESLEAPPKNMFLCWDPWSLGLHHGRMSRWAHNEFPIQILGDEKFKDVKAFRFSSEIYNLAGATDVEEIGILLSSCTESLRFFEGRLDLEKLLRHMSFEVPLGSDPFLSSAKIQALQSCWQQMLSAFPQPYFRAPVFGVASLTNFSRREPWTNLIRMTYSQVGAFLGGARGFRHRPFDVFSRSSFGEGRLSRNLELVLQLESELGRVKNPLQGSGAFQSLVSQTAQKSWEFFQDIEKKGGLVEALQSGWLQVQLRESQRLRNQNLHIGESDLVGITAFSQKTPLKDPIGFVSEKELFSLEEWWDNDNKIQSIAKEFKVEPLVIELESEIYEKWLLKSDDFFNSQGRRPTVLAFAPNFSKVRQRFNQLLEKVSPSGFEIVFSNEVETGVADCIVCIGTDPTDMVWGERLNSFREKGFQNIFWYGEKPHEMFSTKWGPQSSRETVASDLHKTLGGGH